MPETNVCMLTSSERTDVFTVDDQAGFDILGSPLWLGPQCGADCGHWCNLQSHFQSTCAAQVLAVGWNKPQVHTIFLCPSASKLGHSAGREL